MDGALPYLCHQGGSVLMTVSKENPVAVDRKSISTLRNQTSGRNTGCVCLSLSFFLALCLGIRRLKRTGMQKLVDLFRMILASALYVTCYLQYDLNIVFGIFYPFTYNHAFKLYRLFSKLKWTAIHNL